jgi:hypothetical protein
VELLSHYLGLHRAADPPLPPTLTGKSSLLNALIAASQRSAATYAERALAHAAESGRMHREVELFTPPEHDPLACHPPVLLPSDVVPGADVELYFALDGRWAPGVHTFAARACICVRVLLLTTFWLLRRTAARILEVRAVHPGGGALQALQARLDTYDDNGCLEAASDAGTWKTLQLHTVSGRDADACLRALRAPLPVPKLAEAGDNEEDGGAASDDDQGDDDGDDDDALGIVAVSDEYLDGFTLLPEGEQDHTTEVGQQRVTGGDVACVVCYFYPVATVLAAMAAMRRYVAGNVSGEDAAALFASMEEADDDGGEELSEAEEAWRSQFPRSRDAALARAVMALRTGCDLSSLTPADVPATLPRAVARLLGRARRFTPLVTNDDQPGMQERHMRALKRELAEWSRCCWSADGKVLAGNPRAALIACVDIQLPGVAAVEGGRAQRDTRGAEAAMPGDAAGAAGAAATAAALQAGSAAILMVDARTDQLALREAAKTSGTLNKLVDCAVSRDLPLTRCCVLRIGDREPGKRAAAIAALRPANGAAADAAAPAVCALRISEVSDMQAHKQHLKDDIASAIRLRRPNCSVRGAALVACAACLTSACVLTSVLLTHTTGGQRARHGGRGRQRRALPRGVPARRAGARGQRHAAARQRCRCSHAAGDVQHECTRTLHPRR